MAENYRPLFEKFLNYFHTVDYEQMYNLIDPNARWEIKGVPAMEGVYNLQKIKELNKKIHDLTKGKVKAELHEILTEGKKCVAHFTHQLNVEGKSISYDAVWFLELNNEGTKVVRAESIISANPEFFSFAEKIKKAA